MKTSIQLLSKMFKTNFSLDTRSLALFRIGMGLILILDYAVTRIPYAILFYSEKGVLPLKSDFNFQKSSLAFIYSDYWFQLALLILGVFFGVALMLGYRTKLVAFGSWVILISMNGRNPLLLNSGDILAQVLLFWSIMLPLGHHFSLDQFLLKKKAKANMHFSVLSFAFISQVLIVYIFAFIFKNHPIWYKGDAVYYALSLDEFRTQWGDILMQYPLVMKALSLITYYFIEGALPYLFILFGFFWRFRLFVILCMIGFHLGLNTFLRLGTFPWVCMVMWLALLPQQFWTRIWNPLMNIKLMKVFLKLQVLFRPLRFFVLSLPKPSKRKLGSKSGVFISLFYAFCLIYVMMWNVRTTNFNYFKKYFPKRFNELGHFLHISQRWIMFSPYPRKNGGYIILKTKREDNSEFDLWHKNEPVKFWKASPEDYDTSFPVARYRKLIGNLVKNKFRHNRIHYLNYLCYRENIRKNNKKSEHIPIKSIELIFMKIRTPAPGKPKPRARINSLARINCPKLKK